MLIAGVRHPEVKPQLFSVAGLLEDVAAGFRGAILAGDPKLLFPELCSPHDLEGSRAAGELAVPFLDLHGGRHLVAPGLAQVEHRGQVDFPGRDLCGVEIELPDHGRFGEPRHHACDRGVDVFDHEGKPLIIPAEPEGLAGSIGDLHPGRQRFIAQVLLLIQHDLHGELGARGGGEEETGQQPG